MRHQLRIVLLSDTHGFLDPRIQEEVSRSHFAVHAGDIGSEAVLSALRPARGVVAVRGNNDVAEKWPAADRERLEALPWESRLELPGGDVVVKSVI